jgi:hypothetical protein
MDDRYNRRLHSTIGMQAPARFDESLDQTEPPPDHASSFGVKPSPADAASHRRCCHDASMRSQAPRGRAGEVPLVSDGDEVLQGPELHSAILVLTVIEFFCWTAEWVWSAGWR